MLVLPGERVTTSAGWVQLMTRNWGPWYLPPHSSWPPLNPPRPSAISKKYFGAFYALWQRQHLIWNAGSKAGNKPGDYDLIKIASEDADPLHAGNPAVWVAFAIKSSEGAVVRASFDDGQAAALETMTEVGQLGDHHIFVALVNGRPGHELDVARLGLPGAKGQIDGSSFFVGKAQFQGADRADAEALLKPRPSIRIDEWLGLGDTYDAFAPEASEKHVPYLPVHALKAYIKAYAMATSEDQKQQARQALYALLDNLDSPLSWYVAPNPH
jgi:hypothetical protein